MSKVDTFNKWLALAQVLAPAVLSTVPHGDKIAPFVPVVTAGIQEAEQIPGANNVEKKAHVMNLAMSAFQTLQATGKVHLSSTDFQATVGAGIDAAVGTINLVHQAHAVGVLVPSARAAAAGVDSASAGQ